MAGVSSVTASALARLILQDATIILKLGDNLYEATPEWMQFNEQVQRLKDTVDLWESGARQSWSSGPLLINCLYATRMSLEKELWNLKNLMWSTVNIGPELLHRDLKLRKSLRRFASSFGVLECLASLKATRVIFPPELAYITEALADAFMIKSIPDLNMLRWRERSRPLKALDIGRIMGMPVSTSIDSDSRYVPLKVSEDEVSEALQDTKGPPVILLHGGAGTGKTTLVRRVIALYNEKGMKNLFDHVIFFNCASQAKAEDKELELIRHLHLESQTAQDDESPHSRRIRIAHQVNDLLATKKILLVLDHESHGESVEWIVESCGSAVKCLVTSQVASLCESLAPSKYVSIKIQDINFEDARKILANHVGLPNERIPDHLKGLADRMLAQTELNPLAIASVANVIDSHRVDDLSEWENANSDILGAFKLEVTAAVLQSKYPKSFWLTMHESIQSLSRDATHLLLLTNACQESSVPEEIVKILYTSPRFPGGPGIRFSQARRELENRQLIKISSPSSDITRSKSLDKYRSRTWSVHSLQKRYIEEEMREKRDLMFKSLVDNNVQIDPIKDSDRENVLATTLSALYLKEELANGAASRMGITIDNFNQLRRKAIEPITLLLGRSLGDRWKQIPRHHAIEVFLKYICNGTLDHDGILYLLQQPIGAPAMWTALKDIIFIEKERDLVDEKTRDLMRAVEEVERLKDIIVIEKGRDLEHEKTLVLTIQKSTDNVYHFVHQALEKESLYHPTTLNSKGFEFISKSSEEVAGKSSMDAISQWSQKRREAQIRQANLLNIAGPGRMKNEFESSDSFRRSRLRSTIHNLIGFRAALEEEFNPHVIPCMYNIMTSTDDILEMVFFHKEGMASLFGIGLPFSKVSVRPKLQIVIDDVSKKDWEKFWMKSYEGPFKPLILLRSRKSAATNKDSTSSSTKMDSSIAEAVLDRVGLERGNTCEPSNFRVSADDESESQTLKFRGRWMGWVDELLKEGKARADCEKENIEEQQDALGGDSIFKKLWSRTSSGSTIVVGGESSEMSAGAGRSSAESGTQLTSEGARLATAGATKEEVQNGTIRKLKVLVDMSGRLCEFSEYTQASLPRRTIPTSEISNSLGTRDIPDILDTSGIPDIPDKKRIPGIPDTTSIHSLMTIEFSCRLNGEGRCLEDSKCMNVELNVEYQFGIFDHQPFKSGWYHNDLRLLYTCPPDDARRDISSKEVSSRNIDTTIESVSSDQSSTFHGTGNTYGGSGTVGVPMARFKGKAITKTESGDSTSHTIQMGQKDSIEMLTDAPSFHIKSYCTESEMAYRASLLRDPAHHSWPWDREMHDRNKARGMFSTVNIKVKGHWRIRGDKTDVKHRFTADRKLQHHEQSLHKPVQPSTKKRFEKLKYPLSMKRSSTKDYIDEKITNQNVLQKVTHEFVVNHSFVHMLEAGNDSSDIYWIIVHPLGPCPCCSCPVPNVITRD